MLTNLLNFSENIAIKIISFVYGYLYDLCYFLGNKTIDIVTKMDSTSVEQFNKQFNTTNTTTALILGVLELAAILSFIKRIISRTNELAYETSDIVHTDTSELNFENENLSEEMLNSNIMELNFENQRLNEQMMNSVNMEFMRNSMEESIKAVTPFDAGGYVQGPYFNPSDTLEYEAEQSMFNDDWDSFGSDDMFGSDNMLGSDDMFGSGFNDNFGGF